MPTHCHLGRKKWFCCLGFGEFSICSRYLSWWTASCVICSRPGITEFLNGMWIFHILRVLKHDLACMLCTYVTFLQVSHGNLRDLLLQCCMDDASDVRQSAFALLGDLARVS